MHRLLIAYALLGGSLAAPAAAAPTFIFNDTGGVGIGTAARSGFETAAAIWAGHLATDAVIRMDVGFRTLGTGILGQTGGARAEASYASVRSALAAGQTSAADASAVASLGSELTFLSNEAGNCRTGAGCQAPSRTSRTLDADGTYDNVNLLSNTALLKALGLRSDNGARDAGIAFSTAFKWDFDSSNGISRGHFDFVGVAVHEIGHALGFTSGVDTIDSYMGIAGFDSWAWGTPLDLFRYTGADRDWTVGGNPCLSADAGATCIGALATGRRFGDGQQASHWKDSRKIGIMDPTAAKGERLQIGANDLLALDIAGWTLSATGAAQPAAVWADTGFLAAEAWEVEDIQAVPAPPAAALAGMLGMGFALALALRPRP